MRNQFAHLKNEKKIMQKGGREFVNLYVEINTHRYNQVH